MMSKREEIRLLINIMNLQSKPIKADIVLPYKIYLVDHNLNEEKH
jgi:hypothetical protein